MNIAINGFGRIGIAVLKICLDRKLNVTVVNDPHGVESAAYLLKHDSVYGRYERDVKIDKDFLIVAGKKIKVIAERELEKINWKALKVNVVVESTGAFTDRENASKHLKAGAEYVLISAPSKDPDITIVPGVNHKKLDKTHKIVSVASCTTNCLTPVLKVLNDNFQINRALMTTVHAYTNDQVLHDQSHKKRRRGRAGALNIIPTSTGAAEAVSAVMPELEGKVNGLAVRVPVPVGSLVDLVAELEKPFDVNSVNAAFKKASEKELKGILEYSEEELVSSDVIKNPNSALFDSLSTQADGNLIKVLAWYDNEYGYACRVVDVLQMVGKWA
ncbi:type I glyceraldehyde-3-phosphate dehydrogenase [Candidatus Pacearchaeota archaeon]|nr:type I glyceraldehyde-3-phosphate dehydrogenase [Candidatus Pacearchaeota archaeon]